MGIEDQILKISQSLDQGTGFRVFETLADAYLLEKQGGEHKVKDCWYATDLGSCLTGAYYARLSPGKGLADARTQRIFDMGDIIHEYVEKLAADTGILVAKEEELHIVDEKNHARGRPDLLIKVGDHHILYDVKSMHHEGFWWMAKSGFDVKYHHKLQLHFYLRALKEQYPNLQGAILYVSRSDLTFREVFVPYEESIIEEIDRQFGVLNKAWDEHLAPESAPTVIFNPEMNRWEVNWLAKYCSYHHLCTGNENWLEEAKKEVVRRNKEAKHG